MYEKKSEINSIKYRVGFSVCQAHKLFRMKLLSETNRLEVVDNAGHVGCAKTVVDVNDGHAARAGVEHGE